MDGSSTSTKRTYHMYDPRNTQQTTVCGQNVRNVVWVSLLGLVDCPLCLAKLLPRPIDDENDQK